jgi:hypothetical protein
MDLLKKLRIYSNKEEIMSREILLDFYGENFATTIYLKSGNENEQISILKTKDDPTDFWNGSELEILIDNNIFDELYEELFNINIKEVLLGNYQDDDIDDGANIDLSFGGEFNKIHFELWGISKNNMGKRNIKNLCSVSKRILEIAGIDKKEYEMDL